MINSFMNLTPENARLFLNELLTNYFRNGFQTLSKKDLDLLFFYLYNKYFLKTKSIYEISKELKITPSKVKNLQIESYLRWGKEDDVVSIKNVLIKFAKKENIEYIIKYHQDTLKKGRIPFIIENTVEKFEFENLVKLRNGIVGYERNREVITIDLAIFLRLLEEYLDKKIIEEVEKEFTNTVENTFELKEIFTKKDIKKLTLKDTLKIFYEFGSKLIIEIILKILTDKIS